MINKTVIISCAGVGSRLKKNMPKCLVEVAGKPLIEWQLELLKDVNDIRVVVGFKKEEVIKAVKKLNSKVKIYENDNYLNTGTAGSFCQALSDPTEEYVIALDGDLLVNPIDMKDIIYSFEEFICGETKNTENPVLVTIDNNDYVTAFSREKGQYEWAGLAQLKRDNWQLGDKHIYQLIEPVLPKKFKLIRAKEIDTPSDLEAAEIWIKDNHLDSKSIVDGWWTSRFKVKDNYEASRHSINNRIDYDVDLIKKYVNKDSKVLDLGCGTGVLEEQLEKHVGYIKAIDKYQEFLTRAKESSKVEYQQFDVSKYVDDEKYDLIAMFGVTIYLLDEELEKTIQNSLKMTNDNSIFIIKNQWSTTDEDIVLQKQYSDTNHNLYFGIYRSLDKMLKMLEKYGYKCEVIDIYPKELNKYENTHEYAIICRK